MADNQCLQKALEYIDKNITGNISLYEISCEAGFSVPHFYRLFKKLTGDTVSSYIVRRKLALAAKDLINGHSSISSIAFEYGFESHDVFTRAFTRIYGVSPKKYRQGEGLPPLKRGTIEVNEPELDNKLNCNNRQMTFKVLHLQGFEVMGLECNAQIWDNSGAIGRLWSDFLMQLDKANDFEQVLPLTEMYGICEHEHCDGNQLKYMAGVRVGNMSNIPPGMVRRYIREQIFFQANVPDFISVPDAYSGTIGYAKSLGYEIEDYDNIEVYSEIFRDPAFHSFQLLIPIKG